MDLQEQVYKAKVHDFASERIDYDMTYSIDQYISRIEPPVQNEEGR